MCGMAVGKRILTKVCSGLADNERMRSMSGAGTAVSPLVVATMIGKKQTRNTTTIFGSVPKPIHSASSGAMATLGIDCSASRMG